MKTKIAFDVSGLAWKYRTGIQNLYWAYIEAFAKGPSYIDPCDIIFYDRSGIFNEQIKSVLQRRYLSAAPSWWPDSLRRPMQILLKSGINSSPKIGGCINHVYNWSIYNPGNTRASITIPDLLPFEYPQWFSSRFRKQTERAVTFAANEAQFVNCISEDVKQRLIAYTSMKAEKIKVIYPGVNRRYFSPIDEETINVVLEKFKLLGVNYIISSGFLDPRKNLKKQIEAFRLYVQKNDTNLKYVLTGLKNNLSQDILNLLETPDLNDRVIFLGYLSATDLLMLTKAAKAVMYCSVAEGFGLPIIEAMALGVPIVTSNTSSMLELGFNRAELASPEEVDSIALALERAIEMPTLDKERLIISNQKFAQDFTIDRWLKDHIDHMMGI